MAIDLPMRWPPHHARTSKRGGGGLLEADIFIDEAHITQPMPDHGNVCSSRRVSNNKALIQQQPPIYI